MPTNETQEAIRSFFNNMGGLIVEKNKRYGNSALEPLDIFGKHVNQFDDPVLRNILVRMDEKLNRIKNANELKDNDVLDLVGYIALFCVKQGKTTEDFFAQFND